MINLSMNNVFVPEFLMGSNTLFTVILDFEGKICSYNGKAHEIFSIIGLNPKSEDVLFSQLIKFSETDRCQKILQDLMESPKKSISYTFSHGGQSVKWEFSVLKNEEGDFAGIIGVGFPDSLGNSSSKKQLLPKSFNPEEDIFFTVNNLWEIKDVNASGEKFFGQDRPTLIDTTIWKVIPSYRIFALALEFKKAKESKTMRVFEEIDTQSGRFFKVYVIPHENSLDVVFKDISDLQVATKELAYSKTTLNILLEQNQEAVFIVGKDLRFEGLNRKAQQFGKQFFGKDLKIGDKFSHVYLDQSEEEFLKNVNILSEGEKLLFEKQMVNKRNQKSYWFEHHFVPLIDVQGSILGFIYLAKNINDQKISTKELAEKNKVLREVVYVQSMELRGPLSSVLGLLELLDVDQLDRENKKYISYLKSLAKDLDKIIRANAKRVGDLD